MSISEITQTLQELERMYQLNLELLEQLNVVCEYVLESNIAIPNKEKLDSLLLKTKALLEELYFSESKALLYRKLPNENLQGKKPDEDFTEPAIGFWCVLG